MCEGASALRQSLPVSKSDAPYSPPSVLDGPIRDGGDVNTEVDEATEEIRFFTKELNHNTHHTYCI